MRWKKLGLIFSPSGEFDWMQSHAAVPIAENVNGNYFKVYFSTRDKRNRSFTGYLIIDITQPNKIIELSSSPVLVPGDLGGFDDSGAMATWLTQHNGTKYLYYIGWNLGVTVPFRNSIGLATSKGDEFIKFAKGPILDRTIDEPHFVASCCVLPANNDVWRMWYLSCTEWVVISDRPQHRYNIKYAESIDGINWKRAGRVAIDFQNESEYAISRPSVIRDATCWRMWYSYRGDSYRIGFAESEDGCSWVRKDHLVGIDVSASGWDSEMIEYPHVFDHCGQRFMLYNGNQYGKTGFGLAVLE